MATEGDVLVIGGGPAGLRAAEAALGGGGTVILCDAQRSVGRKFLIAGRGGLNLTHAEPVENFPQRYGSDIERWSDLLREFGPADLRTWAAELGIETYVGTSGRVFPRGQKAAGMLRAWVRRLQGAGVRLRTAMRLTGLAPEAFGWRADFQEASAGSSVKTGAIVLALGGASWPETGSDGDWPGIFAEHSIHITPWTPANCGWNVQWQPFRAFEQPRRPLNVPSTVSRRPRRNVDRVFSGRRGCSNARKGCH